VFGGSLSGVVAMLGLPTESINSGLAEESMWQKLERKKREHLRAKVAGCMRCPSLGAADRNTSFDAPACGLQVARSPDRGGRSLSAWSPVSVS
jgi:hypothetical protein